MKLHALHTRQAVVSQQKALFVAMVNKSYHELFEANDKPADQAKLNAFREVFSRLTLDIKAALDAAWHCLGDFMHHLVRVFDSATKDMMSVFEL